MKILTVNFLTCAVKACKTSPLSYPLHFRDAELEQADLDFNPTFIQNILPRVDWEGLKVTAKEVSHLALRSFLPSARRRVVLARTYIGANICRWGTVRLHDPTGDEARRPRRRRRRRRTEE